MSQTTIATPAAGIVEDLVRRYLSLVGDLVDGILIRVPAHLSSRDELMSAGMAALAAAAMGYDPDRGTPFGAFASRRIRWALLDELRGLDWASRSVRSRARRLQAAQHQLAAALGRTPTRAELAEAVRLAVDEVQSIDDDVARAVVLSLHGIAGTAVEEMLPERNAGPEELLLHRERIGYLHHAIDALPERLRQVVRMYFFEERPIAEIGRRLNVTESRVSQLRAEALTLLRDGLNCQLDPDMVDTPERQDRRIAHRREAYHANIRSRGDLRQRLAMTNHIGVPTHPTTGPARPEVR